jgi:hypothetical protein
MLVSSGLTHKHKSRLEQPARNKHSSLLGPFICYEKNKVFLILPLISITTFSIMTLSIMTLSIKTLSMMILSVMTLSMMTLSIKVS